jgi:hypothetical protein
MVTMRAQILCHFHDFFIARNAATFAGVLAVSDASIREKG